MKKIASFLERVFQGMENTPLSLPLWVTTFFFLIAVRLTLDLGVERFPTLTFFQLFFQWTHLFLFFLFSYLLLLPLVMKIGMTTLPKAARVLLFGFLLILIAPIADKLIFGSNFYWSFYIFDSLSHMPERFVTFFGDSPNLGITYGTRLNVALILLAVFLYGLSKTRKLGRTLFYTLCLYAALFFLGTLPSWLTYGILAPHTPVMNIASTHVAEVFLSPETILNREVTDLRSALGYKMGLILILGIFGLVLALWYSLRKKEWLALFSNARWPQIICQNGILFLGALFAFIYTEAALPHSFFSWLALLVLVLANTGTWISTIFWNDLFDQKIDQKTNPGRPLAAGQVTPEVYRVYALCLALFSLLGAALVSFQAALLLISYQALAWLYSAPPFRLKRFLGIATLTVSAAALVILCLGYLLFHQSHTLDGLPLSLLLYLGAAYALMLPLKDFKDVAGDQADRVYTLPVVLGVERAKIVMSTLGFLVFMSSIFVLHAPELLLWAFIFATLSFWIIQRAGLEKSRVRYRDLMGIFVVLAFLYGVGLVIFLL